MLAYQSDLQGRDSELSLGDAEDLAVDAITALDRLEEQLAACEELLRALTAAGVIRGEWAARVREALGD